MIIIFNFIGAGILIAAVVLGSSVAYMFGDKSGGPSILVEGLVAIALDVLYRTKREEGSLIHPRKGGHVCFIPVWIIGVGFLFAGGYGIVCGGFAPAPDRETMQ